MTQSKPQLQTMEDINAALVRTRKASAALRGLTSTQKNLVLVQAAALMRQNMDGILSANAKDLQTADQLNLTQAMKERLTLDAQRIEKIAQAVEEIAALPDPVGKVVEGRNLPNGIALQKTKVPLGVVGVIYESRPNVSSDISALALKSGNAAVLRGGKEALHSNVFIVNLFKQALKQADLPPECLLYIDNPDRALLPGLLKQDRYIDIIVPRGGEGLIRFVAENSTIPVIKHDKGVCSVYVDEFADFDKAVSITINGKVQRPSVCNAVENLIIHTSFPKWSDLLKAMVSAGVQLHGDKHSSDRFTQIKPLGEEGYGTEYLDLKVSVKFVSSFDEALDFIGTYSSGHSEAIVSENYSRCEDFVRELDSAAIFINCSTRFHDGGEFGLGAEVGISTDKLHVRGPMGLDDLTTTKWVARGSGQIRE